MDIGTIVFGSLIVAVIIGALIFIFWIEQSTKKSFKEFDDKLEALEKDPKTLSGNFADLTMEDGPLSAQGLADFGLDETVIQMVDSLREKFSYKAGSKPDFDLLMAEGKARYMMFKNRNEPKENLEKARELVQELYKHEYAKKDGHALIDSRILERHIEIEEIIYHQEVVAG